jgi:hypothetical protein
MAFLLARFLGLLVWWHAFAEVTFVPDRLFEIGAHRTSGSQHYYAGLLLLLIMRIVVFVVSGSLLWWNAPRVGRWLEGKAKEEHQHDVPPLSSP